MKIYKTKEQIEKDIIDNQLTINDDVRFECDFDFPNCDIHARDIDASNIDAYDIDASDIDANNIDALNINADDIRAWNIKARDIDADDINYYAVCFAYQNIKCKSIIGRRENSKHFCLDGEIEIISEPEEITIDKEITINGKTYVLKTK
ncbi:MAG: hypothetical protein EOL97_16560 [Spirochaetia bacterium]|nr:hypothetical protein [Spirochaetia bacterium]